MLAESVIAGLTLPGAPTEPAASSGDDTDTAARTGAALPGTPVGVCNVEDSGLRCRFGGVPDPPALLGADPESALTALDLGTDPVPAEPLGS